MNKKLFLLIPLTLLVTGCNVGVKTTSSSVSSEETSSQDASSSNDPGDTSISIDPGDYYGSIDDSKSGSALKTDLHNLIKITKAGWDYSGLWTAYRTTDKRDNGTVWDIYSDQTQYKFGTNQCGNYSVEGDCYNREHMIPQSVFSKNSPMVSDIHHVYPSDGKVNGMRSDYPHGIVTSASYTSNDGYKLGTGPTTGAQKVFEPKDVYKGDIARIYFYFVTCYQDKISSWSFEAFSGNDLDTTYLDIYLKWAIDDPVSNKEVVRNQAAYVGQKNRNPFVDHPEYACKIWGDKTATTRSLCGLN